jgi:molecular chaperone DnaJ
MANKRDYYEVLGVGRTASDAEIAKAFRTLGMKHHPDRNPGDPDAETRFKEVGEAYEVLKDPAQRRLYDQYGHDGPRRAAQQQQGHGWGGVADFVDAFTDMFTGGGRRRGARRGPQPGQNVQTILDIDLLEAATGVTRTQVIPRHDICPTCTGSRAKPGTKPSACRRCNGQGAVLAQLGPFQVQQECPACGGEGVVLTDPCGTCRGNGRVETRVTLDVKIPPGVDTGTRLAYERAGDEGDPGAPRGDVYFDINVRAHKTFHRDGHNLVCRWAVSVARAALGGPVEITTLTGEKVTHDLPRGTQTHEVIRLKGHGMPRLGGGPRGDLLVQVVVETPTNLSPEQEQLFRKLAELEKTAGPEPQKTAGPEPRKGFFGKLKDRLTADGTPTDQK